MKSYIIQNKHYTDLNPTDFGYEHCTPGKSFGPYIRDYYLLHFVVSGKGRLYCDNTVYNITSGQFFIINPDEVTTYKADEQDPWHYIWIGFTGSMADKYDFLKQRVVEYSGSVFYDLLNIEQYENTREEFLLSKLYALITELSADKHEPSKYVKATKIYIQSNYMIDIHITDIAKDIGIDRSYLSKLFKSEMNMTFQEYLILTRLTKATEFLKKGFSVKEVAFMCGYKEPCTFSRAYKKHFHSTPKSIKKLSKELK